MKQDVRDRVIATAALCAFAVYLALGIMHHEAWRDEWQAINIARAATSLPDLYQRLRYEGHPALWYLLIRGAWEIFPSLASVQLLNAAFALAAAALVAFLAPWPLWLRLLVSFTGPAAWEYSVKARSYGLGWLLIVALALILRRPAHRWKPWTVALIAALALNTSLFTGIVAFSLVLGWLWEERRDGLRPLLWPMAALAAGTLGTFLLAAPPADVAFGSLTAPRILSLQDVMPLVRLFTHTMLPYTNLGKTHFTVALISALAVVFLCIRYLNITPGGRIAQTSGWLCILLFFFLKIIPDPFPWHLWHLFLMTIAANIAFERRAEIPRSALTVLAVFATLGLNSGIREYVRDWNVIYSAAQPAAQAIKRAKLDHLPVVVSVAPFISSLSGYLGHPIYDASCSEEHTYKIWRTDPSLSRDSFNCAYQIAGMNDEQRSLFTHSKKVPDETVAALAASYRIQMTLLGSFVADTTDENYYVYLITRFQP